MEKNELVEAVAAGVKAVMTGEKVDVKALADEKGLIKAFETDADASEKIEVLKSKLEAYRTMYGTEVNDAAKEAAKGIVVETIDGESPLVELDNEDKVRVALGELKDITVKVKSIVDAPLVNVEMEIARAMAANLTLFACSESIKPAVVL